MRSNFNILWVEDQEENVTAQKEGIKSRIKNEGFRLKTQFAETAEEAQRFIKDEIYGDNIDLILMDYNLGLMKTQGDEALASLRNIFKYKEVIFYSAIETTALEEAVRNKNLEGIFCCHRDELIDTVMGIFETLIKKTLDLNHSRGIILGMACEIDSLIKEALAHEFDTNAGRKCATKKNIERQRDKTSSTAEKICKELQITKEMNFAQIQEIKESKYVLTSEKTAQFLRKILNKKCEKEFKESLKDFVKTLIPRRNELAHLASEQKDGFMTVFKDKYGGELTKEEIKKIRCKFLQQLENLEKLRKKQNSS